MARLLSTSTFPRLPSLPYTRPGPIRQRGQRNPSTPRPQSSPRLLFDVLEEGEAKEREDIKSESLSCKLTWEGGGEEFNERRVLSRTTQEQKSVWALGRELEELGCRKWTECLPSLVLCPSLLNCFILCSSHMTVALSSLQGGIWVPHRVKVIYSYLRCPETFGISFSYI